jgi:uncharacterized protein (TIGR03437 family)
MVNAASYQPGFASGTWVSIFGDKLSTVTDSWKASDFVNGALPTSLDGVSVTINGLPAYVAYVSPTLINALVPDDPTTGAIQVQVTSGQLQSNLFSAQKAQFAPAFFLEGPGPYLVAQHADYTLVTSVSPAAPGEVIVLYGTGFGPGDPPLSTGQAVTTPSMLANAVQITVGGVAAPVDYSGLVGPGLYQFNVRVPDVPNGDAAVVAKIGGVASPAGGLVSVQK